MADQKPLDIFAWLRMIAVARILMPKAMVRLSAGRLSLSKEAQAMAFLAGANAIFTGDKLLTTPNPESDEDMGLLAALSLKGRAPDKDLAVEDEDANYDRDACCGGGCHG
jgi:biotin synthase